MELINILTRTHREKYFKVCRQSVMSQTYENLNHVVGSDTECSYFPAIPLQSLCTSVSPQLPVIPAGHYYAPWNKHLNTLQTYVTDGWCMALDEDDKFTSEKSVARIMDRIDNENQLIIWKVQILPNWIVPSKESFGKYIKAGDFSGIGMAWHSKYKPDWGEISYGDFRAATQLIKMGLKPKWIDLVLTATQNGPHNGK